MELFCPECQKTHDCRTEKEPAQQPSPALPAKAPAEPQKPMTEEEAYQAYVREINPFITCEECGESYPASDMWKCPDCGMVLCQICREKHRCAVEEPEKKGLLAAFPFLKGKKAAQQETAEGDGPQEEKPEKAGEEEQVCCDGCGKTFPKSKMRKCRTCGAVLCPKCRKTHVCKETGEEAKAASDEQKTDSIDDSLFEPEEEAKEVTPPAKEADVKEPEAEKKEAEPTPEEEKKETTALAEEKESGTPEESDGMLICIGCGMAFPKSKMRKCRTCGDILCPKCRKKHTCKEKTEEIGKQPEE